ncbi:superoxide dismutase family protein [Actinomadura graeca]|uniref:Superoxide dismutase [Cu-Zn] n=1 Tax=Actinomadura graeca TaxID=2750812 RepID=A0ABX8QRU9_9ACTN|nr:superoxide dismutase family protein [Actinomadura graeca]QXJ21508.1 superoxide dismutase family protein [Actinomadura graeca]
MKRIVSIAQLTALATLGGLAGTVAVSAAVNAATDAGRRDLTAQIRDVKGEVVGTLTVAPMGKQERLSVRVMNVAPGFHGFHIHTTGKCDPNAVDPSTGKVSPFFTAGTHLNLDSTHTHPSHSGDLPNLLVNQDGRGQGEAITDRFTAENLMDADGSAIIIHVNPDNHANIPDRYATADGKKGPDAGTLATGDAGGRAACGVISQSGKSGKSGKG